MSLLKLKNKKEGMLLAVILIFAFITAGLLFSIISLSSSVKSQTKKTIAQYQAYLMGESALQHAKMHLLILPEEVSAFFRNAPGSDNMLAELISTNHSLIVTKFSDDFDLFEMEAEDVKLKSPYDAEYRVKTIKKVASAKTTEGGISRRSGTTSTYEIAVASHVGDKDSVTMGADPRDFLYEATEEFTVSTVGLGVY